MIKISKARSNSNRNSNFKEKNNSNNNFQNNDNNRNIVVNHSQNIINMINHIKNMDNHKKTKSGIAYFGKFNSLVIAIGLTLTPPISTVPNPKDSAATVAFCKAIPTS